MENKHTGRNILLIAGSIISFCIGSGFATGQEVLQFFTGYGTKGIIGGIITAILYVYVCVEAIHVGKTKHLLSCHDIFKYYCGKYIGTAFEWYNVLLTFLIYVVMLAGAGSIFSDYFGFPVWAGRTLMALISAVSVIFGLNRLADILGRLGPVIILGCLAVAVAGFLHNPAGIAEANAFLEAHKGVILAPASNWWISSVLYCTYLAMPLAVFVAALESTADNDKQGRLACFVGAGAFGLAVVIVALAELANLPLIADSSIPMLLIAGELLPALGAVFSIVLVCGIYSTACPLLWTVTSKFAEDKTAKFRYIALGLMLCAYAISFLPFKRLVNFVYGNGGWLAIIFLAGMIIKSIQGLLGKDKNESPVSETKTTNFETAEAAE